MSAVPVAYLVSRFPKITETFILDEVLEMERQGQPVELFAFVREREDVVHPRAVAVAERAHYVGGLSSATVAAQMRWLRRRPRAYLGAWAMAIRGNVRSPGFLMRSFAVVPAAACAAELIERRGIRHIHAHWATHPALGAMVISRLTGCTWSFTAHAHDIFVDRTMLGAKARAASFVATISRLNRDLIEGEAGPGDARVEVVRCGIDPEGLPFTPLPAREGPLRIACVAALEEKKGHVHLLHALDELRRSGIATAVDLVGDGPLRAEIERTVEALALGDVVRLRGRCTRDEVRAIVGAADVAVLPSVVAANGAMEGIPVALMEAMALGRPVVATDISAIAELVHNDVTGLLVPQRDAAAIAAALRRLEADPDLARRLAAAGRARVENDYSITANVARLRGLLQNPPR